MKQSMLYIPPAVKFFKGDIVSARELVQKELNPDGSYRLVPYPLAKPLIAPIDDVEVVAGQLRYNLFDLDDVMGEWRDQYDEFQRSYRSVHDNGYPHALESKLELVERGEMWKHYHDPATTWESANDEANYLAKAGIVSGVPLPKGLYKWSLGSMMAAVEWGVAHALRNYTMFGHYTEYPITVGIPEVGRRLRAETLEGMKTWREEFPDRAYDYVRAQNIFYWQSRGHKRPPLVVSIRHALFSHSTQPPRFAPSRA